MTEEQCKFIKHKMVNLFNCSIQYDSNDFGTEIKVTIDGTIIAYHVFNDTINEAHVMAQPVRSRSEQRVINVARRYLKSLIKYQLKQPTQLNRGDIPNEN